MWEIYFDYPRIVSRYLEPLNRAYTEVTAVLSFTTIFTHHSPYWGFGDWLGTLILLEALERWTCAISFRDAAQGTLSIMRMRKIMVFRINK